MTDEKAENAAAQVEREAAATNNIPELKRIAERAASEIRALDWQRRNAEQERDSALDKLHDVRTHKGDPEEAMRDALLKARIVAVRALVKLLPKAVRQANAGKPALLRLILRSTR